MVSLIDPTFITSSPVSKTGMRTQLGYAKTEIEALQALVATAETDATTGITNAATAQSAATAAQTTANTAVTNAATAQTTANTAVTTATTAQTTANNALPKSGGTLTGTLTLAADPALALQAATKQYVDGLASFVKSVVSSSTSEVQIAVPSGWSACRFEIYGFNPITADYLAVQVRRSGIGTFDTSGYSYTYIGRNVSAATVSSGFATGNGLILCSTQSNANFCIMHGMLFFGAASIPASSSSVAQGVDSLRLAN